MLLFEIWTKDFQREGFVTRPLSATGSIKFNGAGSISFVVDADHPLMNAMTAEGARARVLYRYAPTDPAEVLLSGPLSDVSGAGARRASLRTLRVADDWTILSEILGLPNPTGTMSQQGDDGAYFTSTGPAETVVKELVSLNAARQGVSVTVPTTTGLGSSVSVAVRMHPLTDRLFPAVDQAGVGVRVRQIGAERVLEVWEPATRPLTLTEESGVVADGDFQITGPAVTRVIVGAGGEGEARVFREFIDTDLEARFGVARCVFQDARDVAATDPALETLLAARAAETLAEGAPKVALRVVLAETEEFRFGKSYELGDRVTVRLGGGPDLSDLVREIQFDYSDGDGLKITPIVGDWSESTSAVLWRTVAVLSRSVRDTLRR